MKTEIFEIPELILQLLNLLPNIRIARWDLAGLQDLWAAYGWWCLLALPLLTLATVVASKVAFYLLRRYLHLWERKRQATCPHCQATNHPGALACRNCKQAMPEPMHVDSLGLITSWPINDRQAHRLYLLTAGRCLVCAESLPRRTPRQPCPSCGTEVFPSQQWRDHYLAHIRGEFHSTVGICLALSVIPILGLIPWVLYDAESLPTKLRRYSADQVPFGVRLHMRIVILSLLSVQWIPLLGAASLPVICMVQCAVYGRALADASLRATTPQEMFTEPTTLAQPSEVSP